MRILTLGNGFIGNHLPYPIETGRIYLDEWHLSGMLSIYEPGDVLINCIGFCGNPNIDECEFKKLETYEKNTLIPVMLANLCEERDIRFINISSGCIFSGQSPHSSYHFETEHYEQGSYPAVSYPKITDWKDLGWKETDPAEPPSTYSRSKYACDLLLEPLKNTTMLRIRMPLSSKPSPRNLLSKLIGYEKVIDQPNSITVMSELSRIVDWVIKNEKTGIYNCTNPTPIKHSDLLEEYRKYFPDHKYQRISEYELSQIVKAPRSNCILDSSKLSSEGFKFQNMPELIQSTIKEFVANIQKK